MIINWQSKGSFDGQRARVAGLVRIRNTGDEIYTVHLLGFVPKIIVLTGRAEVKRSFLYDLYVST